MLGLSYFIKSFFSVVDQFFHGRIAQKSVIVLFMLVSRFFTMDGLILHIHLIILETDSVEFEHLYLTYNGNVLILIVLVLSPRSLFFTTPQPLHFHKRSNTIAHREDH